MDGIFGLFVIGLAIVVGWFLGVIGFFRASAVRTEMGSLRRALEVVVARQRAMEGGVEAPAPVVPEVAPVVPEVAPVDAPEPALVEATLVEAAGPSAAAFVAEEPPPAMEEAVAAPSVGPPRTVDLETVLTQRWGVWLGSVALLFAGVFLVRYSVEQGWLGPAVRCAFGALLGAALLAAAEWLRRRPAAGVLPDLAPGGLAAGGVAVLFGAAYGVGAYYELVPPGVGFVLMAAVAMVGLAASLRFGPLAAAVGLAAAYTTPALVDSDNPSLIELFAYLSVVTAACWAVVRYTAWIWLGWAATVGGVVWVLFVGTFGGEDSWAPAAYVVVAAALNMWLLPGAALEDEFGHRLAWIPFTVLMLTGLALGWLEPGWAPRLAVLALSSLALGRAVGEARLDRLPWIAALGGLLALLGWRLPAWGATSEVVSIEGVVQTVLPGAWAPGAVQPFLITAGLFAAFHAASGLWMQARSAHPLRWAALPAAVPLLCLVVVYWQASLLANDMFWGVLALGLAAALIGLASRAMGLGGRQLAGVYGAGAAGALVLALCFVLHDHWLTLAFALMLPALAWIEAEAMLPQLRRVALVVAILVLVRLLLNVHVLGYALGLTPIVNGLVLAYALPAAVMAVAAWMFRRGGDDLLVRVLEAGAVLLGAAFVVLEIRHATTGGDWRAEGRFAEAAADVLGLVVQAWCYRFAARHTGLVVLDYSWRILGVIGFIGAALLVVLNPLFSGVAVGTLSLLCAYVLPAVIAILMAETLVGEPRHLLRAYALAAVFLWITLQVRAAFHPGSLSLSTEPVFDAEMWSWSGAWMLYGIVLLSAGVWRNTRETRLAGLAVIALVSAKVFIFDMSALVGLWRVASFLGLGLMLISLSAAYRRFGTRSGG